jgi:WD40 repeat protein
VIPAVYWRFFLFNRIPFAGRILRWLAVRQLCKAFIAGDMDMARLLAERFCLPLENELANSLKTLFLGAREPKVISALWETWIKTRADNLGVLLTQLNLPASASSPAYVLSHIHLKTEMAMRRGGANIIDPLLELFQDQDAEIAAAAFAWTKALKNQAAIDRLCARWAESRCAWLENAILTAHYQAEKPLSVWMAILLKTGRLDQARQIPPEGLDFLLAGVKDSDPTVAANALTVLGELKNPDTIAILCQRVIESEDRILIQTAVRANYRPQPLDQCAQFLFLTGQQEAYEALDFDRRIMQAVYEIGQPALKNRIVRQVQISGKTDNLVLLEGLGFRLKDGKTNGPEIEMAVRLLAQNQEWNRLWGMVFELPLLWSIEIIRILRPAQWQPEQEYEKEIFNQLTGLASGELLTDAKDFAQGLPLALQRATLKVRGRVNDLAFANDASLLAIGTGERKLGLWNFQKGAVDRMLGGFDHSISQITFCGKQLLCGQRSNQGALCSIYGWQNDQAYLLGSHVGAVTSLIPVNESQVLSTGRDQRAVLWDLSARRAISEVALPFWARAMAIAPDRQMAALAHTTLSMASLPDLTLVPPAAITNYGKSGVRIGAARTVTFTPQGDGILVGQVNGQVVHYEGLKAHKLARKNLVVSHRLPVNGLQFIPGRPILASCSPAGMIQFNHWPGRETMGNGISTGSALTSLHISADGSFMATGTTDARIILWDLRVLGLPDLLSMPTAQIKPGQAAVISSLINYNDISAAIRNTLSFFMILVQHRFQYNIEIEEAATIARGEFDVIID